MENMKSKWWSLLMKYDHNSNNKNFCDAVSRIIQNKFTKDDLLLIFGELSLIDTVEIQNFIEFQLF